MFRGGACGDQATAAFRFRALPLAERPLPLPLPLALLILFFTQVESFLMRLLKDASVLISLSKVSTMSTGARSRPRQLHPRSNVFHIRVWQ